VVFNFILPEEGYFYIEKNTIFDLIDFDSSCKNLFDEQYMETFNYTYCQSASSGPPSRRQNTSDANWYIVSVTFNEVLPCPTPMILGICDRSSICIEVGASIGGFILVAIIVFIILMYKIPAFKRYFFKKRITASKQISTRKLNTVSSRLEQQPEQTLTRPTRTTSTGQLPIRTLSQRQLPIRTPSTRIQSTQMQEEQDQTTEEQTD